MIQALSSAAVPRELPDAVQELLHPDTRARRSKTASFSRQNRPHTAETLWQRAQMMSETSANVQPSEKEPESTNKPPSSEADSKKRAPTPESDDNSAELICKPQPKKPKTQKKPKVPVTKESVIENCKDGDAYVAKVLGTDKVDAVLLTLLHHLQGPLGERAHRRSAVAWRRPAPGANPLCVCVCV